MWQIGMDLVGPLHKTPRGHKYIMTVTDYYTKWAEAAPLKDKTATSVADVLYSVSIYACKYAVIHEYILVTDNISIHCR